jgi:diguanylate cyclase (GGDEF)-like protein/PAS domain S-box-containing protein
MSYKFFQPSYWRTIVTVVVVPIVAYALQRALLEQIHHFTWFFFWPAMFVYSVIGTRRDSILATLVCTSLVWWFFMQPTYTLLKPDPASYFSALFYIGIGITFSVILHQLRTSQQQIQDLLSQSEESRGLLLRSLADGVFVAQDYRFVFHNHALPAMLGYTSEEFQDISFARVIAPAHLGTWTARFEQRVGIGPEPQRYYETQFLRKNGKPMWIELRASKATYHQRPAVLGIVRDVSERKQQEEHMRLSEAVFNYTQEAVVVTDLKGNILTINPAFSQVTEYSEAELIGKNIRILQSGRHDRDFYRAMWRQIETAGNWQGAIWNRRKSGDIYHEWLIVNTIRDAAGKPLQYVGISLDISRSDHVETQMEHMAHHDALTDLPNRLLLHSRLDHTLERAQRDNRKCALLFLDLDRFKQVNDNLGHAAGDELLKQAAQRMRERLRDTDTLARLGGDEFVVVLDGILGNAEAESMANVLIAQLSAPFELSVGATVHIGTSVGIAIFPTHSREAKRLMELADTALYQAKMAGKGRLKFYQAE